MGIVSRILMVFKAKASSALDRAEDPRQLVDYAYAQQQELLFRTKRGLVEVATSKVQLTQQCDKLRSGIPRLESQAKRALKAGREDLARIALERKQTIVVELEQLDIQVAEVAEDQTRLTRTEQQLAARLDEFRTRRDVISARYTAAQASVRASEAFGGVSGEFADLSMALGRAVEKTDRMQARARAVGSLIDDGTLALPGQGTDMVEMELQKATVAITVEDELSTLKAELVSEEPPPALGSGT